MKHSVLIFLTLTLFSQVLFARSILPEVRDYITYYENKYPRTELHFDELKSQLMSPEEKSAVGLIYEDHETLARAQQIAILMDPFGPQNNYQESLADFFKLYFNQPKHRRALQSIFDAISATYFSAEQQKHHHDRMTSFKQHLIDHAEWTWGIALLWSLRGNHKFINNKSKWIKPFTAPLKWLPPRAKLYAKSSSIPLSEQKYFTRLARGISQKPGFRWIIDGTKETLTFTAVTSGTAALFGTPAYFLYQANLWPFNHKNNPKEELEQKHHQMALLQLGCETLQLKQELENTNFSTLENNNSHKLTKEKINDLVDAKRFLFETAFFYNTSQKLNPDIHWDSDKTTFSLAGDVLSCPSLAGLSKEQLDSQGLLHLPFIGRLINQVVDLYTNKLNQEKFSQFDRAVDVYIEAHKNIEEPFSNITEALTLDQKKLQENVAQRETFSAFMLFQPFVESINNTDKNNELAKNIVSEWSSKIFNTYILHLLDKYYVSVPASRKQLILFFYQIALNLENERQEGFNPEIEKYLNPLNLVSLLHNFNFENLKAPAEVLPENLGGEYEE